MPSHDHRKSIHNAFTAQWHDTWMLYHIVRHAICYMLYCDIDFELILPVFYLVLQHTYMNNRSFSVQFRSTVFVNWIIYLLFCSLSSSFYFRSIFSSRIIFVQNFTSGIRVFGLFKSYRYSIVDNSICCILFSYRNDRKVHKIYSKTMSLSLHSKCSMTQTIRLLFGYFQ